MTGKKLAVVVVDLLVLLYITNRYWHHKRAGLIVPISVMAAFGIAAYSDYALDDN